MGQGNRRWRSARRWLGLGGGTIALILLLAEALGRCDWELFQDSSPIAHLLALPLAGLGLLSQAPDQPDYQWLLAAMVSGLTLVTVLMPRWRHLPSPRSRALVVAILGALTLRYMVWRVTATLNFATPADGIASLTLLLCEGMLWVNSGLDLALMLRMGDRRAEADRAATLVASGYQPSVDVWIPTYGEPVEVLRRTVIGCQALDYGPKRVYLLDDGRRPEVQALAIELGCGYITRSTNQHAKAGNLNHAIGRTHGQLIVCFDADFVPTRDFLQRTVGLFHNPRVGLVQTHQHFFNPDPISYNLGLADRLTTSRVTFSRYVEPVRDGALATICCGSSFMVRRSALEQVGGFVTSTLCEDYFTGISLISSGYQVLYLDEALSAGLSPESMSAYIAQQQRWAAGTMQGFFIPENPLTVPGLTLLQRLHYAQGWLYWGSALPRLLFLVVPVLTALLGLVPMKAGWLEWVLWFAPLYVANWATCNWLSHRSCSAVLSDIYAIVNCVPIVITVIHTLLRPFGRAFRVTPKGIARDRAVFNRMPGLPLLGIWGLTLAAMIYALVQLVGGGSEPAPQLVGLRLSVVWLAYNLLLVGMAVLACVDAPKPSLHEWFGRQRSGQFQGTDQDQPVDFDLRLVSEAGAIVAWPTDRPRPAVGQTGLIHLLDRALAEPLTLPVRVLTPAERDPKTGEQRLELAWQPLTLAQQRSLIEWIYCQPGQWQPRESPGELASLGLLLRCGLRPRRWTTDRRSAEAIALP